MAKKPLTLKPLKKLKAKADRTFSRYIRLKNSVGGYCTCVTCGISLPIAKIQNGHYIPRNVLATRYDEDNCYPQCVGCNIFKSGNLGEYAHYITRNFGVERLNYLHEMKHVTRKITAPEYEEMIDKWEDEIRDMETGISIKALQEVENGQLDGEVDERKK